MIAFVSVQLELEDDVEEQTNCGVQLPWLRSGVCGRVLLAGGIRSCQVTSRPDENNSKTRGKREVLEHTRATLTAIDRQPPPVEHGQTNRIEPVTQKSIPVDLLDKGVAAVCEGGGPKKLEN